MDWIAAKDRWLSSLLLSMEDVVEGHMTDMLSFGGPISHYYRKYEQQQRMGISGMLTDVMQQLFSEEKEYAEYLYALSVESYIWGETWAKGDISKEVLLQTLYNLRQLIFERVRHSCTDAEIRDALLSRLHEILNIRYYHAMRGYLACKDQMISHLHRQKIGIIEQMAAGMAHEIRNPLTAVNGFLQLMRKTIEHDGRSRGWEMFEQYIQICQHEMQSLNNLVTSFLILARKNETGDSQNEIVELRPLMERVHELAKHYVMEKEVRLSFGYAEPHVQVWAIPSYVEQICLNLIKNAMDAVAHNGYVTIYTETSSMQSFVSVTIEDNGCGISEQRQKHLFEPFYITKEKGTGIGLSVCKKLLEEMGGKINIQSTVGVGTKVEILFAVPPAKEF
ncbi:PAS domain-containing sensor histidine kinase [Brevibacillus sp. DP1.3A]|uniref:sensor histidine kinase n=1 Tax=Brevibacillus sp. DP1.3A TaxID=2738867 RepID=UPI00156A7433|nr:HAMP domain-containing sensor histidine kinase [Brevibacillus sp. DP1.3A]UED76330.1 HAMP domain-containing histidine kinase [Brevibacillus sp. DP1.3A]